MKNEYGQVNDFQFRQASKLENSSYLEDLTGLLAQVASRIDNESSYFFGKEYYLENFKDEPNSNFMNFVNNFKKSIEFGSSNKINIIRGRAGIGKTLFFKKGVRILTRNKEDKNNPYIYLGVDFKNIDNDNTVEYYKEWIYKQLYKNAIDCIRILGEKIFDKFEKDFENFGNKYVTDHTALFPVMFFCKEIYLKYQKPCIIVFDNIDLASAQTQENVFRALVIVDEVFKNFMSIHKCLEFYRIYFAMRPETKLRYREGNIGDPINFPLPNILKISLAIIKKELDLTALEFDNTRKLSCDVTCQDVFSDGDKMITLKTFSDVSKYMYKILDDYLSHVWNQNSQTVERLGTSEEFHCNIVNYNVRTFVKFLADTISNGGFKPLTKEFNQRINKKYYNLYDYVEMIIRGRWPVHPGNQFISGEGGNKAPIVFNVFDTSLYGFKQKDKVKHFMLNIRILQYCFLCIKENEVEYEELEENLANFFDKNCIHDAAKKLICVRFLYSHEQGEGYVSNIQNWKEVKLDKDTKLTLSPMGKFYLEKLICEFEYLYQMSLSSLMCKEYIDELKQSGKTEKEKTVLFFLKSIFEIIKDNIDDYGEEKLIMLEKIFYSDENQVGAKPFRHMLDRYISVMHNKVLRAEKYDESHSIKLKNMLQQAINLREEAKDFFISKFGE